MHLCLVCSCGWLAEIWYNINTMKNHSKKQIEKAIRHWKQVLEHMIDGFDIDIVDDSQRIEVELPDVICIIELSYKNGFYGNLEV